MRRAGVKVGMWHAGWWLGSKRSHSHLRVDWGALLRITQWVYFCFPCDLLRKSQGLDILGAVMLILCKQVGGEWFQQHQKINWLHWLHPTLSNPHQGPLSSCRAELKRNSCGLRTDTGHQVQPEEGEQEPRRSADALLIWIYSFSGRKVHTRCPPNPHSLHGI